MSDFNPMLPDPESSLIVDLSKEISAEFVQQVEAEDAQEIPEEPFTWPLNEARIRRMVKEAIMQCVKEKEGGMVELFGLLGNEVLKEKWDDLEHDVRTIVALRSRFQPYTRSKVCEQLTLNPN
jgi:hypothetical protein